MIFAKNTWRQRLRSKVAGDRSQMLAVQVADLILINTYTPPDIEEGWDVVQWFWCGDFNDLPEESESTDVMKGFGGEVITIGVPTRWEGSKNIDWAGSNHPWDVKDVEMEEYKISDHVPIRYEIKVEEKEDKKVGTLKKSTSYVKPAWITKEGWQQALGEIWKGMKNEPWMEKI